MEIEKVMSLRPADRVIVPKSRANIVQHHGIYAGQDGNGQHWFLENHHESGVRYATSEQFFSGVPTEKVRIRYFSGNDYERSRAINHAKSMLGKRYDLFLYNCEHYSNEVQFGKPESQQVTTGLAIAGLFTLLIGAKAFE